MNPVTVGFINGTTPIIADATSLGGVQAVLLSTNYQPVDPPGWPSRPPPGVSVAWSPRARELCNDHS